MARNLMRSLAASGRFDPSDLVERHLEWFRGDPPDVGTITGRVLRRVDRGEDAAAVAKRRLGAARPEVSAGNGSVMVLRAAGLAYANRPATSCSTRAGAVGAHPLRRAVRDGRARRSRSRPRRSYAGEPAEDAARSASAAVRRARAARSWSTSSRPREPAPGRGPDQGFCLFTAGIAFQALVRGGELETELRRVVSSAVTRTRTPRLPGRCSALATARGPAPGLARPAARWRTGSARRPGARPLGGRSPA